MIAVDTNLLIYAHREDVDFHSPALQALSELGNSGQRWAIPWPCVHEFISITTHPRIFDPPTPLDIALQAMEVWISSPACQLLGEGPGYWDRLRHSAQTGKITGPMIHDARIAALCIHHGVNELWSADRDFSRFSPLTVRNPLAGR